MQTVTSCYRRWITCQSNPPINSGHIGRLGERVPTQVDDDEDDNDDDDDDRGRTVGQWRLGDRLDRGGDAATRGEDDVEDDDESELGDREAPFF